MSWFFQSMKSKSNLPLLFLIFPFLLVSIIVAYLIMRGESGENLEVFPVNCYRESPLNYYGNRYLLECQVNAQLAFKQSVGRLVAVEPEFGGNRLSVFIPDEISQNLHVNQRYKMSVYINNDGLIQAERLEKY